MFREAARRHGPHAAARLGAGVSVVLDFAANTPAQRRWPRTIAETARVRHRLPVLDMPGGVCRARLRARNAASDHSFKVREAWFREFTRHVTAPPADESLCIVLHREESRDLSRDIGRLEAA